VHLGLTSSTKGRVEKKTLLCWREIFFASQRAWMTEICSEVPHHVLGCWTSRPNDEGSFSQRFRSPVRSEAVPFRNRQSRTWAFGVNP
jgi:hypothetical protein